MEHALRLLDLSRLVRSQWPLDEVVGQWVLVGRPPAEWVADEMSGGWAFRTRSADSTVSEMDGVRVVVHADDLILPLRKRVDKRFPSVVLIGRASSNDVEIAHASVSKLHARFEPDDGAGWITDAESRNGTKVDGALVPPNARLRVQSGAIISFGSCRYQLLGFSHLRQVVLETGSCQ